VAFAARCARRVLPLFEAAWPDAAPRRREALEQAITLAEQSAAKRQALRGLEDAVVAALVVVAGRAQIPHLQAVPSHDSESPPLDQDAAVIATLSARVAERAAVAAAAKRSESGERARDAYYFALDVIRRTGRLGLVEVLEADFAALVEASPKRAWWRFW
jgi:hypothetical protein